MVRGAENWRLARLLGPAAVTAALLLSAPAALAADTYVNDGGSGLLCTLAAPCDSVSDAVGLSGPGDTTFVDDGTYNENVTLIEDRKLVHQEFDTGDGTGLALIDGGVGNGVTVAGDSEGALVEGFTLRGGNLALSVQASATIRDNIFDQALPAAAGPNVQLSNGSPTLEDNEFTDPDPSTEQTGVTAPSQASPVIRGNAFSGFQESVRITGGTALVTQNEITGIDGGDFTNANGIYVQEASPTISRNEIGPAEPSTTAARGVDVSGGAPGPPLTAPTMIRNTISGVLNGVFTNSTDMVSLNDDVIADNAGTGLFAGTGSTVALNNATVVGNGASEVRRLNAGLTIDSSIVGDNGVDSSGSTLGGCQFSFSRGPTPSSDPCDTWVTAADPGFVDAPSGDYHLLASSPLIDMGNPAAPVAPNDSDMDGEDRAIDFDGACPLDSVRDIGADELQATEPFCPPAPTPPAPKKKKCKRKKKGKAAAANDSAHPPANPSTVFFGLMRGANACRPKRLPA